VTFELITPPTAEPFSLTDLKAALRIDHSTDDDLLMKLGVTARRLVERRLSLALATQTWRFTETSRPYGRFALRPGPVTAVNLVEAHHGPDTVAVDDWRLIPTDPATVEVEAPSYSGSEDFTALQVTFTAGLVDVSAAPVDLVQAILMLTAHYYEHREAVAEGRYVTMPQGIEAILKAHREVTI